MSKESPDATLVDRVADAAADLGTANDEVDRAAAEVLGVNRTDLRLLGLVVRDGPLPAGRLAAAAALSPAATTTAVQRLVRAGHVTRDVDPVDHRRAVVRVTDSAAELLDRIYGPLAAAGRAEIDTWGPDELAVVDRFLRFGIQLQRNHAERIRALR